MGCIIVANKFIADVQVDEKRKALSGPGLAQYLHWRGASLALSLGLWLIAVLCNMVEVYNRYWQGVADLTLNHASVMFYYVELAALSIQAMGLVSQAIAWAYLCQAFALRRKNFVESVKGARKSYVLDVVTVVLAYVVVPLALFFSEPMLRRDYCMFTLTHLNLLGPISRQAFASAAAMSGMPDLAIEFHRDVSLKDLKEGRWIGKGWCNAHPQWLEMIFGPDPSVMPMNPAYYSASYYSGAGLIPSVTFLMEGMTGAKCPQPGMQASLSEVTGGYVHVLSSNATALLEGNDFLDPTKLMMMQDYVCVFKDVMTVTAQYIRMSFLLSTNIVGVYCTRIAMMKVFPPCSSLCRALSHACLNVKSVAPQSSLPGYLVVTAVLMFVPPLVLALVFFNQIAAHPFFALGVTGLVVFEAMEFNVGMLMTESMPFQRFMKKFKPIKSRQNIVRGLAGFFLVTWLWHLAYNTGSIRRVWAAFNIMDILNGFSYPATVAMVCSFLFHRNFSTMVYTDYIFAVLFDAEDDALTRKSQERKMHTAETLRAWYRLNKDEAQLLRLAGEEYDAPARPVPKGKGKDKDMKGFAKGGKSASKGKVVGGLKGKGKGSL
mmetsp:Transcript_34456/g.78610  ORF Transcript_34456/g.78610 Transcript_34456/m.78610 type:complete len:603 (+) Transcript_34456:158-1966(+)